MQARIEDIDSVAALRHALWPEASVDELFEESRHMIMDQSASGMVFLAYLPGRAVAVGFAEVALRHDHVNGCSSNPVAFLEGIYVDPQHRRRGIAMALVDAAAAWGRAAGASEFASDALLENVASHRFHVAAGFTETERVVYFRQSLGGKRR